MELHPKFQLNGKAYTHKSLLDAATTWTKDSDAAQNALGTFLVDWLSDSKTMLLQTSGSTGTPKTLEIPKAAMHASAERTGAFFKLSPGITALLCLPVAYIAGKMMLVRALVLGLDLDIIAPKTKLDLQGKTYDFAALIPMQVAENLHQLTQIKTVLIGGAPIAEALRKKISETHTNCVETYGMTETLTHVATRPVTYPTPPFTAMPDVGISLDSENCLRLNLPYISKKPIQTNDIVEKVDKNSFRLLGRRDFVINSGGKKIFPEQLEEKLRPHLNIPFFITGIPDTQLGEKLILILEGSAKDCIRALKIATTVLGNNKHHVPKSVLHVNSFVFTPSGKLDRKGTKELVKGQ